MLEVGTGEMAQKLRVLADFFVRQSGLIPSTPIAAHYHLELQFQGL